MNLTGAQANYLMMELGFRILQWNHFFSFLGFWFFCRAYSRVNANEENITKNFVFLLMNLTGPYAIIPKEGTWVSSHVGQGTQSTIAGAVTSNGTFAVSGWPIAPSGSDAMPSVAVTEGTTS